MEAPNYSEPTELQQYLTEGVETILKDALRATFRDPKESLFMARFAAASRKASGKREENERNGLHVPSYLIASITSSCNLHCAGCYSRANHATEDCAPQHQLTTAQWEDIFRQAEELGISFILLAGGEPLLRYDVIEAAGKHPNILFPIFTNGTFLGERYMRLLDRCRNLIPVISIEGDETLTDSRRGDGIWKKIVTNMEELQKQGLLFGCSITVTTENLDEVLSGAFIRSLASRGCKAAFYIEFVPVTDEAKHLAPGDEERELIRIGIDRLRLEHPEMVFVSFPGDEKSSGGCLAAGRGFFHINSHGGAEPCPFSPYSDINVAETSLREALNSGLFHALRDNGHLLEDHVGGCVLYEKRALVEKLLHESADK
ncbi:MAG: radical SAM protein [Oscillospiraceae bacterium]|nr:radical SAM protein [Oscillospiraceae bacterium]